MLFSTDCNKMLLFVYKKSRHHQKTLLYSHVCARDIVGHHICQIQVENDKLMFNLKNSRVDYEIKIGNLKKY